MQEAQPDPIPNGKLQLTMTTIVVVLGIVASLKEPFPNVGDEGVAVPE
jgi:exosome complex RNA-binding protein Rrp42 (RNase PH superfamily)